MWWTYLTDKYFAIMYGLLLIEKKSIEQQINAQDVLLKKSLFMERAKEYRINNKIHFWDDDWKRIEKIDMMFEYKEYLENHFLDYHSEELDEMVKVAKEIINSDAKKLEIKK